MGTKRANGGWLECYFRDLCAFLAILLCYAGAYSDTIVENQRVRIASAARPEILCCEFEIKGLCSMFCG